MDTSVFLNLIKNESNLKGKDLADPAEVLFWRSYNGEFKIVLSDWTATELAAQADPSTMQMLFTLLCARKKIVLVSTDDAIERKVKKFNKAEEFKDADSDDYRHALLAVKSGASYIVTKNMKDFVAFRRLVEPKLPEDI